jgi:drug/metabolite transporter (DMT)-like permease
MSRNTKSIAPGTVAMVAAPELAGVGRYSGPMDALSIALVLAAAGAHAGWNLLLHADDDRVASIGVAGLVSLVALLPFLVLDPPFAVWPSVLVSGAAETVYALALAGAYARGDLAATYAVGRGTAPLLVTLAAWSVLSQPPTVGSVTGAGLLFTGLVLLAVRAGRARMLHATGLAVVVGVAIATYSLSDARAMLDGATPLAYLAATLGLQGILTAAVLRFDVPRMRRSLRIGALIALGSVVAYGLVLVAFSRAPAGRVATLREVSVLIALLVAREHPGRLGWIGAGLVVAGAFLAAA